MHTGIPGKKIRAAVYVIRPAMQDEPAPTEISIGATMRPPQGLVHGGLNDRLYEVGTTREWVCLGGTDWTLSGTSAESDGTIWEPTSITTAHSPYLVGPYDTVVLCDAASGPIEVRLGSATTIGHRIVIKKVDETSNGVLVTPSGSETIDRRSNMTISLPMQSYELVSDGTSWWIIG